MAQYGLGGNTSSAGSNPVSAMTTLEQLQQQLQPANNIGGGNLLSFGMPAAAAPPSAPVPNNNMVNIQGLQLDPNLLRSLLFAQGGLMQQQQPALLQGVQQRPDPPTVSAAAFPLFQGITANPGQFNLTNNNNIAGGAMPAATVASNSNQAVARRPRHTQTHLVDNSGVRRVLLYVPTDDDSISPYQVSVFVCMLFELA